MLARRIRSPDRRGVVSIITILLFLSGAVLGTFVLGLGGGSQPAEPVPEVAFEFETSESGTVTITHEGGEMVSRSAIEIRSPGTAGEWDTLSSDGEIAAGDEITVSELESGDTVRIVWDSPDGDTTAVLGTYEVR